MARLFLATPRISLVAGRSLVSRTRALRRDEPRQTLSFRSIYNTEEEQNQSGTPSDYQRTEPVHSSRRFPDANPEEAEETARILASGCRNPRRRRARTLRT